MTSILRIVVLSTQSENSIVKNSGRYGQVVVRLSDSHKVSQFVKYAIYSLSVAVTGPVWPKVWVEV
jgi:CRISPR/Cas system type I-B associated protein Csh2 (Cas7 group RAMP superfamily)